MSANLRPSGLDALLRAAAFTSGAVLGWRGPAAAPAVLPALAALALGTSEAPPSRHRGILRHLPALFRWGLFIPLLCGMGIARLHWVYDPARALLDAWRAHGYVAGTTPVLLKARLLDRADLPGGRVALVLRMEHYRIPGALSSDGSPPGQIRLRLTLPMPPAGAGLAWTPGDCLVVTARVEPPRNFRNPGAFDYAGALRARGISLVGTIKDHRLVEILPGEREPGLDLLPRARRVIVARLRRASGEDRDVAAAFLGALLVGERDDLPAEIEEPLIQAGVYHIVALSGLNVAVIASLASFLLGLAPCGPGLRRIATASAVFLYWLIARDSGSLTRAALMALLYITGALLERRVSALGSVAVAAMLLIVARPEWMGDPGFQLTFGATVGLVLLARGGAPSASRIPSPVRALLSRGLASIRISAAALAGTAPVTACHFQTMAPIALLANLYAIPLADLLLLCALAIVLCEPILPGLARTIAILATGSIDLLIYLSRQISSPPGFSFHVVPPPSWVVAWTSAVMVLSGACSARKRWVARICLAAALTGIVARGPGRWPPGRLDVVALDVGQGDGLLLRLPDGFTILVDAGGFGWGGFDVGERVVAPALRAMGLLRIDILAVTHAHRDHLGGAAAILKQFSPGALWLGRMPDGDGAVRELIRLAATRGIAVVLPRRGVSLSIGGARIEVLNPGLGIPPSGGATNNDSLVLRVLHGGRSALLTGDLEAPIESILIAEGRTLSADLLKVGHHGSRTSTTAGFLARVGPCLALISVGSSNPWGHPDSEVLTRLEEAGARVYRTDRDGAVRFRTDGALAWTAQRLTQDPGPAGGR